MRLYKLINLQYKNKMKCDILTYNIHGLPWSKCRVDQICDFIAHVRPDVVCLQEAFTDALRARIRVALGRVGYVVCIPRDSGVTWLPSGLICAFLESRYELMSSCFCPYQHYHNVEWFANKGFYALRLRERASGRTFYVGNTHMQSNTEISWLFGSEVVRRIRRSQGDEIVKYFSSVRDPWCVVGDFNCDRAPCADLRFLHQSGAGVGIRKSTFYSTGEDLDHMATGASCVSPKLEICKIYDVPYSDHAPVRFIASF